ncbi:FecR family protein [Chitinophaga japonensis]|uniref:FecR family protein n=1 Tax=Chitinophaga japonensis TaxID=104662 RepID=A0A562T5Z8_CHIJA|nr:FecR domain-containing protein [Chitinophaga japonensis]TWI88971.1 FecR family protein [Chitinophaga japonensis]
MKHSIQYYADLNMYQLAAEPYFLEWVRCPDDENREFWEAFLAAFPRKKEDVARAAAIAGSMYVKKDRPLPAQQTAMWDRIRAGIDADVVTAAPGGMLYFLRRYAWKAAAVLVLALVASWLVFRQDQRMVQVASAYGEVKQLILPDGTIVVLNGNTSIRYSKSWNAGKPREVWVDGEAFFKVKPLAVNGPQQRFEVHSNEVDVRVLGTSFNVRNRRGVTAVVLNTGKVMVAAADNRQMLLSKPGDMVRYKKGAGNLEKRSVPVKACLSWQQHKLQLDQTSVADLFAMLEDDWGYHIVLKDSSLLHKQISGELDMADKQILIEALAVTLDAKVTQQGTSTIIVMPN